MMLKEYFGITDDRAFSGLVVAGFSAIMVGAVFLIISILVVNAVGNAAMPTYNSTVANGTLMLTYGSVITNIGQALQIGGVALIIVGVAVIIAVLLGMTGGSR
jgi:hypothetical protein